MLLKDSEKERLSMPTLPNLPDLIDLFSQPSFLNQNAPNLVTVNPAIYSLVNQATPGPIVDPTQSVPTINFRQQDDRPSGARPLDLDGDSSNRSGSARRVKDGLGLLDSKDFYRFDTRQRGLVSAILHGASQNLDLYLYDNAGNLLERSENSGLIGGSTGDYQSETATDAITGVLNPGTYYLEVRSKAGSTASHYELDSLIQPLGTSSTTSTIQNLQDDAIRGWAIALNEDGNLNRQDLITLARASMDDGALIRSELSDLRNLASAVGPAAVLDTPNSVLLTKLVNGDASNRPPQNVDRNGDGLTTWSDTRLGSGSTTFNPQLSNPLAGMRASDFDRLVGYHLEGSFQPEALSNGVYRRVEAALFDGINVSDITQGAIGDCYLLSTLASIAASNTTLISNMIRSEGDGLYTVRFFTAAGVPDYVTVNNYLPTNTIRIAGRDVTGVPYAGLSNNVLNDLSASVNASGNASADGSNGWQSWLNRDISLAGVELWVALIEKAFAKWAASGNLPWATVQIAGTRTANGLAGSFSYTREGTSGYEWDLNSDGITEGTVTVNTGIDGADADTQADSVMLTSGLNFANTATMIPLITGLPVTTVAAGNANLNDAWLRSQLDAGRRVVLNADRHAWSILGYQRNAAGATEYTVFNPWGSQLRWSFNQIRFGDHLGNDTRTGGRTNFQSLISF